MTTNSLASIESLIASASDPDLRAESICRFGIGLAQVGRIDEASQILEQSRIYLSSRYILRVLIRTMILEAIIPYYRDFIDGSDRLRRAHALASAAELEDLRAETSVWLAHLSFNFDDLLIFGRSLSDALDRFSHLDDAHKARLSLVCADALQFLGRREAAAEWYGVARQVSRNVHDHGLMVAIEFNRVAMSLSYVRIQRALGLVERDEDERNWSFELNSVRSLHYGFGAQALLEIIDLCDAHALEMQSDYLEAADALMRLRGAGGLHRCGVSERLVDLEVMWCRVNARACVPSLDWVEESYKSVLAMTRNDQLLGMKFLSDIINRGGVAFDSTPIDLAILNLVGSLDAERRLLSEVLEPINHALPLVRQSTQGK